MQHDAIPLPVLAVFQGITILDVIVLGSLSAAIVSLLVFIVVRGESRAAARVARRRAKVRARTQATVVQTVPRSTHDEDEEITIITMALKDLPEGDAPTVEIPAPAAPPAPAPSPPARPKVWREDDVDRAIAYVADPGAEDEEPTRNLPMILVSAAGQTDRGKKRKRNEDRYAVLEAAHLYVVADGMGGYAGGQIASQLACDTIVSAYTEGDLDGPIEVDVPRRAGELALAVQMANRAIFQRSQEEPGLKGMGTTVVCARFAPRKQRVYIGHVGDSRCYRLREGQLEQLTQDHTMARFGVTGRHGAALSRAVGVGPGVNVDLIIAEPRVDDVFLLCSDGLTKMVPDHVVREVLVSTPNLEQAVQRLIDRALDAGGKDNVTVVLVGVQDASGLRRSYSLTPVSPPRQ